MWSLTIALLLSVAALNGSAQLIKSSRLHAESRELESALFRAIDSASSQRHKLTLYFTASGLSIFHDAFLIDRYSAPKNFELINQASPERTSWLEDVYASGVQSPFTISLSDTTDFCLITVSLRGRIVTKCFID